MKVVALVSGGKDSCFTMMEVAQQGHQVVALANLLPIEESTDDLDSWMYQTVGHQVVATLAECTGLPMFRRRISGTSKAQALTYRAAAGDEVEDLYALLAYCKHRVPELQAVCSGAIASDYQRTRVESVCSRLGLVSLAPLWRRPQGPLLDAMVSGGVTAVIAKVAAAGLTPDRDLGAELADMIPRLHTLRRLYGCNVCGEGGEYETLTLDCPAFACGRIVLDGWSAVPRGDAGGLAPVALLRPTKFHVEPKPGVEIVGQPGLPAPVVEHVPDAWLPAPAAAVHDPALAAALEQGRVEGAIPGRVATSVRCSAAGYYTITATAVPAAPGPQAESTCLAACLFAVHRELERALHGADADTGRSAEEVLVSAGDLLRSSLFVHLFIPDMAHFAGANAVYGAFLPEADPPARATVQAGGRGLVVEVLGRVPLPASGRLATFTSDNPATFDSHRKGLHVQSISGWAPACIGPYAQAVAHAGVLRCAGQIGLDPASMTVVPGGLISQTAACLRHCTAVGVACASDLPRALLSAAVFLADAADARVVDAVKAGDNSNTADAQASSATQTVHNMVCRFLRGESAEVAEPAAGDGADVIRSCQPDHSCTSDDEEEEEDAELDTYLRPPAQAPRRWEPLLSYIQLPQLPRGVLVEIQPNSLTADALTPDTFEDSSSSSSSDDDDVASPQAAATWVKSLARTSGAADGVRAECLVSPGAFLLAQVWIPVGGDVVPGKLVVEVQRVLSDAGLNPEDVIAVRAYDTTGTLAFSTELVLAGQVVPVIPASAIAVVASDDLNLELGAAAVMLDLWAAGPMWGPGKP